MKQWNLKLKWRTTRPSNSIIKLSIGQYMQESRKMEFRTSRKDFTIWTLKMSYLVSSLEFSKRFQIWTSVPFKVPKIEKFKCLKKIIGDLTMCGTSKPNVHQLWSEMSKTARWILPLVIFGNWLWRKIKTELTTCWQLVSVKLLNMRV